MELDHASEELLTAPLNQYILTQVGHHRLAFRDRGIAGMLLVERSQVLALPFYPPEIVGVVHHQGQLVPLVDLQQLLDGTPGQLREVFHAVQLNEASHVGGLGLVVDRVLGNWSEAQVATDSTIEQFQPHRLKADLWQPQRWGTLTV
jgi:chemotaxis protein histidine kinase CheA